MLKVYSDTGVFEATAEDEKRVRALSDAEICRRLNRGRNVDVFLVAELRERPHIQLSPYGWMFDSVSA